jgi:hypothetical protein
MTERFEFPLPIDSQFDRLVDGELTGAEECALLSALDARPEGWRRCALAFLEARAWKKDFHALASPRLQRFNGTPVAVAAIPPCATGSANADVVKHGTPSFIASNANWPRLFALAASVTLGFFLGIAAQRNWLSENTTPREMIADGITGNTSPDKKLAWHDDQQGPNDHGLHSAADSASSLMMTLVDGRGDAQRQIEVPLVETDRFDPSWLASQPAAMLEDEVEELRRLGYRVDQQRFYVPVMLDDGRQAIVPLDRANIRYAGMQF